MSRAHNGANLGYVSFLKTTSRFRIAYALVLTRMGPVFVGSEMSGCRVVNCSFTCVCPESTTLLLGSDIVLDVKSPLGARIM